MGDTINRWDLVTPNSETPISRWDNLTPGKVEQEAAPSAPLGRPIIEERRNALTGQTPMETISAIPGQRTEAIKSSLAKEGATFDPEGAEAPGGMFAFRVGRGLEQGGIKAARHAFATQFPEGDLVEKDLKGFGPILLYNEKPGEPYKIFGRSLAVGAGENLNARNIAAGVTALMTSGMSIPASVALTSGATFLGSTLDSLEQKKTDQPDLTGPEVVGRAALHGGINAAVQGPVSMAGALPGAVTAAGNQGLNMVFRRTSPEVNALIESVKKEGLKDLSMGQVSDLPITRMMTRQTATTSPVLADLTKEQMKSVESRLLALAKEGHPLTAGDLQLLDQVQRVNISNLVGDVAHLDQSQASAILQDHLKRYEQTSKAINDKQYNALRMNAANEDIHFDISGLIQSAAELERGVLAPGQKRATNWAPIVDEAGNPVTTQVQLGKPTKQIQAYIDDIKKLAPTLKNVESEAIETSSGMSEGVVHSAVNQLQALRAGLFDLMHSPDALTRVQATKLWNETANAMSNPSKASPTTRALLKVANDFNAEREATLGPIMGMINKEEPGNMAARIIKPGNYKTLSNLRETLTANGQQDGWNAVVDGFKSDLLTEPSKIATKLDAFSKDRRTLEAVLTPKEQQTFRELGNQAKLWDSSPTAEILKKGQGDVSNAFKVATEGHPETLDMLISAAEKSGKGSEVRTNLRAGIYQHILDTALVTDSKLPGKMINPQALIDTIDALERGPMKARLDKIFTDSDWSRLRTMADYISTIKGIQGSGGAAIGAAEQVSKFHSGITMVTDPERWLFTVLGFFNNQGVARILAKPATANALEMALKEGPTKAGARSLLGASLGAFADAKLNSRE